MDVSFYISELLSKHGEISVPGLGYLVKAYVPGHYNESDGKFYPPYYLVQFDPQQIEDDNTLTQYIADVKNISLESSKYFTDKFITEIRENAFVKDVAIADLGWFYTDQGRLLFKPASAINNDPAFFGYAPVSLKRLGEGSAHIPQPPLAPPVIEPTVNIPPIQDFTRSATPPVFDFSKETPPPAAEYTPPPMSVNERSKKQALIDEFNARNKAAIEQEQTVFQPAYRPAEQQQYVAPVQEEEQYEEEEERRRPWGLIILFSVILVLALAFLGIYKFAPTRYEAAKAWFQKTIGHNPAPAKVDSAKVKSTEQQVVLPPKIDPATADSIRQAHVQDSIKMAATADSLAKAKIADAKKTAAQRKQDSIKKVAADKLAASVKLAADKKAAQVRKADSIKKVNEDKKAAKDKAIADAKIARERKADSLKTVRAALAAAKAAKTGKVIETKPADVPIKQAPPVVLPEKKTKPVADATVKQKTTTVTTGTDAAIGTPGLLKPVTPDPTKQWLTIAKDCTGNADALATINKLKQLGINAFVVRGRPGKIRVATQAFDTNDEADAASNALKTKGFPDAYLTPINQQK